MTQSLKLIESAAGTPVTTIDLLGGTLKLRDESWIPAVDEKDTVTQVETFALVAQSTSLLTSLAALQDILRKARDATDDPRTYNLVHFEWTDDETSTTRHAVVHSGGIAAPSSPGVSAFLKQDTTEIHVSLTRGRWESKSVSQISKSSIDALGGYDTTTSTPGTFPARIGGLEAEATLGGDSAISKLWIGVREKYEGVSGVNFKWECEDGDLGTDASLATDSTASPGSGGNEKVTVSFSTQTGLVKRLSMTLEDFVSTPANMRGSYRVLMRMKTNSSGAVGVQVRYGYEGIDSSQLPEVKFGADTTWRIVDLGEVSFPPFAAPTYTAGLAKSVIEIWAEQLDTGATVDFDVVVMMPARHMVYIENCAMAGSTSTVEVGHDVYDGELFYAYDTSLPILGASARMVDFEFPPGDAVMVVCREHASTDTFQATVDLVFDCYPRWMLFAGS